MPIATDLQPWMGERTTDPTPPTGAKPTDAEYQTLIDLINRYAVVLGLGENFRDLAWAKRMGMTNVQGTLTGLQGDIERGVTRRIGAAPTEAERGAETAKELLGVWELEAGITPPGVAPDEELGDEFAVPSFPSEAPPEGYRWELNELNQWVPVFDPYKAPAPTRYGAPDGAPKDPFGRTAVWNERLGEWDYPPNWGQPEAGWVSPFEEEQATQAAQQAQQRIDIEQQQAQQQAEHQAWQQAEAQRQYGAQLAAQPQSWLQYHAYTGTQPGVQPWMQPLMPQQYAGLGAGAAIPGWQAPQAQQMGGAPMQGMAGLPELTRPSRQYQARMGPTALAQYGGYQQARTGIRPEELQFRLWAGAPPGGQHQGLRYTR